jgi:ferredoxin-thioredoxin reductase catalytic subunit
LINDIKDFAKNAAERNGWSVQPNETFLKTVLDGLIKTREAYGYYLCPCREGWGNRFKDRDITCPCEYAGEDIAEFGHCYCGLFLSAEAAESGREPEAIPDRRPESLYPD